MTETIRYSRIGKEDLFLDPRDGTMEVTLADGRVVTIHAVDLPYLLGDAYARASLPTPGVTGRLARVTDAPLTGALVIDDGTDWRLLSAKDRKFVVVTDPKFGARGDGITDDTAAIQAAIDYAAARTLATSGDLGTIGGVRVIFPHGRYLISSPLRIGVNGGQTLEYVLEGEYFGSWLIWAGGNDQNMITVGRPDGGNISRLVLRRLAFSNGPTSGSGITALRPTNINGVALNNVAGINRILFDEVYFTNLSNGIVATTTGAVNQCTLRKCLFGSIYNATSPVVNPLTDALVAGRGNAIYFASGAVIQGLYISDCDFNAVQGYLLDSQATSFNNLVAVGNYVEPGSMQRALGIRLAAFTSIHIHGNEIHFPSSGGNAGTLLDLGTTALGSSNVSGGSIMANYLNGTNSAGQDFLKLTFADGIVIGGNSFFNSAGSAIRLAGANVSNVVILPNNYVTVTTKLTDGGATGLTILDRAIATRSYFPDAIAVGTTPATAGTLRVPYGADLRSRNQANTNNTSLIYLDTLGGVADTTIVGSGGDLLLNVPMRALGGGAVATLGTIGGTGPTVAAQNEWEEGRDATGAKIWRPIWK